MKLYTKIVSLLVVAHSTAVVVADNQQELSQAPVAVTLPASACHCGPTEHWFYKACVKNYNKQFSDACLPENYDTEGLPANILQAIEMLALDMQFVAQDGTAIVPTLSAKGNVILSMSKNPDYVICKQILHNLDTTTTLPAEQLYQAWVVMLHAAKIGQ